MSWWESWRKGRTGGRELVERRMKSDELLLEIQEAHRDWVNAQRHFEYALGKDQVDYAIFAIEAAEKRYEMLLRQAKGLNRPQVGEQGEEAG